MDKEKLPNNLPVHLTNFVGRENEIVAIGDMLTNPTLRLMTLVGPGGIGKTRLSQAIAEGQLTSDSFSGGIFFVPLAGLEESGRIVSVIAEAMQIPLEQGEAQLFNYLKAKQILLVLDNFEHLLDGSDLITQLLQAAPQLQILVTSRERLKLQGEQVYPLEGLLVDDESPMDDARQLFVQAAHRIRPDFDPTPEVLPHLNRICRQVEGMPLALELAAAWLDTLTLADIAAEIQRNLDFLETDLRDMPARHRSMRAVFDTSWQNLSANTQQLLAQIAVFRGGFTRDAALTVTEASLRDLATLVNKSLLRFDAATNRYHIHELLRQYSLDRLIDPEARTRHCAYYLDWVRQQAPKITGPEQDDITALIEAELDNVRAAINQALRIGRLADFDLIMQGLVRFYYSQGRGREGLQLVNHIRTQLETMTGVSSRILFWATALEVLVLGGLGVKTSLWPKCRAYLADLVAQEADVRAEQAFLCYIHGHELYIDQPTKARELLQQGYELSLELGDRWQAGYTIMALARSARNQGDLAAAETAVAEGFSLFQALGDRSGIVEAQLLMGNLAGIDGRYDVAEQRLVAGIATARTLNRPWQLANGGLNKLAMVYFFSGRFSKAIELHAEVLQIMEEYHYTWAEAQTSVCLGLLHMHLGQYAEAQELGQQALEIGRAHDHNFFICEALVLLAQTHLVLGNLELAKERLQESDQLCEARPVGMPSYLAGNGLYWGLIAAMTGEMTAARDHLRSELEAALARKDRLNLVNVIATLALLYAVEEDAEAALEHFSLAQQNPFVANSHWFAEVVEARVKTSAETLPSEEIEVIRQQSSGHNLETLAATILAQLESPQAKKLDIAQPLLDPLSQRELEVLRLVAEGRSNRQIADELVLALGTVKSHLHNIFQKLAVSSRMQAIVRAKELDLL